MATRLINAIGKGLGKTTTDAAKGAARRATRDVPSTKSFYNLGMGIGPFIRNTVQAYGQGTGSTAGDAKSAKANIGFAKENVVSQKNMAGQLSALTSIMSDIRKISLAQLNLQRASMPKGAKGFGDRSGYLSQEQMLESGKPSLAGSGPGAKGGGSPGSGGGILGFMANNPMLSAGLLGAVYLGFKKDIDRFLKDSGLTKLIGDLYDKVKNELVASVKEGISSIYESIKTEFANAAKKVKDDPASAITPSAALGGAIAANRLINKVPIVRSIPGVRTAATVAGGVAGYLAGEDLEQLYRDANMEAKTPEEQERKEAAKAKLAKLGVAVGGGVAGTIALKKGAEKIFGSKAPPVTPTTVPGATSTPSSAPPSTKIPEGKPLTQYGSVGENREMAKNKTLLEKSKANFSKTLQLLRKLIAKIGMPRVAAYVAARFAAAAAIGATGFAAGPVGFITTALTIGLTIYELYDLLSDLDKEVEETPATSQSNSQTNGNLPGANPTQPPAASQGDLRKSDNAIEAKNQASVPSSPIPGKVPHSGFGMRMHPIDKVMKHHDGVDYPGKVGDPVHAVMDGEVTKTGDAGGLGKSITILHDDGTSSIYGHLSDIGVSAGKKVKKGEQIGKVGNTGKSTGPHLHLEIHQGGQAIDPKEYFNQSKNKTPEANGNNQSSVSGTETTAPGPSNIGQAFASAFGFDPSRMGVDLTKTLSGDQIAKLNALQKEMGGGSAMIADAINKVTTPQQTKGPSQPSAQPAPGRTADNTQSREKDDLWYRHNPRYNPAPVYT